MSIWRLACCPQIIAVVLFLEGMLSVFIIFNPIQKKLILHGSVTTIRHERFSKTAEFLDFPLHFLYKRRGKSRKSADFGF